MSKFSYKNEAINNIKVKTILNSFAIRRKIIPDRSMYEEWNEKECKG